MADGRADHRLPFVQCSWAQWYAFKGWEAMEKGGGRSPVWVLDRPGREGEKKACLRSQAVLPMRPGFVRVVQSRLQAEGEEYARHTPCLGYSGVSSTVTTITAGIVESDSHVDPVLPGDSGPGSSAGGEG